MSTASRCPNLVDGKRGRLATLKVKNTEAGTAVASRINPITMRSSSAPIIRGLARASLRRVNDLWQGEVRMLLTGTTLVL